MDLIRGMMILTILCVWMYIIIVYNSKEMEASSMTTFGRNVVGSKKEIVIPPWAIRENVREPASKYPQRDTEDKSIFGSASEDDESDNADFFNSDECTILHQADDEFIKTDITYRSCDASTISISENNYDKIEWIHPTASTLTTTTNIIVLVLDSISRKDFESQMPKSANALRNNKASHFDFEMFHAVRVPVEEKWPNKETWNYLHNEFSKAGFLTLRNHEHLNRNDLVLQNCDSNGRWIGLRKLKFIQNAILKSSSSSSSSNSIFLMQHIEHTNTIGADEALASFLSNILNAKNVFLMLVSSSGDTSHRNWKRTYHGKQNALLPLLRVVSTITTTTTTTIDISIENMQINQHRLITIADITPSLIRLAHRTSRRKKDKSIFHDMISLTRSCSDANISSRFCLCSKWIKSKHPPFAMLETLLARMNRDIRDNVLARRRCEILHLSRVIESRVLSRSTFLSRHGPHLISQRYRFRFLVYGKGPVVDTYEADVVNFLWHIERSSSSSYNSDMINPLRHYDSVKKLKDSGTIIENVYIPLMWKRIVADEETQDECARDINVPCLCRQSIRKNSASELEKELAFLYHTDSSKAYIVVNKNELKIIRRIHMPNAESFEIYNGRDEDITFVLSLREERTLNVITSRPMPVSVIVPARTRRHVVTIEQGDMNMKWKRSIRWKWHALRSNEIVKSSLDYAFSGSLNTDTVSYTFDDGIAMWRIFDMTAFLFDNKFPTLNVYARNVRRTKVSIRVSLGDHVGKDFRVMSCENSDTITLPSVHRLDSESNAMCLLRVAFVTSRKTYSDRAIMSALRSVLVSLSVLED